MSGNAKTEEISFKCKGHDGKVYKRTVIVSDYDHISNYIYEGFLDESERSSRMISASKGKFERAQQERRKAIFDLDLLINEHRNFKTIDDVSDIVHDYDNWIDIWEGSLQDLIENTCHDHTGYYDRCRKEVEESTENVKKTFVFHHVMTMLVIFYFSLFKVKASY